MRIAYNSTLKMYQYTFDLYVKKQFDQHRDIFTTSSDKIWQKYKKDLKPFGVYKLDFTTNNSSKSSKPHLHIVLEKSGDFPIGVWYSFPLFKEHKIIAHINLFQSFSAIKENMDRFLKGVDVGFILRKDLSLAKNEEFAPFSKNFLRLKEDKPTMNTIINHVKNNIIYIKNYTTSLKNLDKNLSHKRYFSTLMTIDEEIYGIYFYSILSKKNRPIAYIVSYDSHPNILKLEHNKETILIFGILFFMILYTFLFLLILSNAKTVKSKKELQTITNTITSGIVVFDKQGRMTFANKHTCKLLQYNLEELLGENLHDKIHYHEDPNVECNMVKVGRLGTSLHSEEKLRRKDGTLFDAEVSSAPLIIDGEIQGVVTIFRDITEKKQADEKIKQMAYHDSLTNLPNRKLFFDKLSALRKNHLTKDTFSALIYIDIDNFKSVNDTYGHKIGDELLVNVAKRVASAIRSKDTIARLGGDEFVAIIESLDEDLEKSKEILDLIIKNIFSNLTTPFKLNMGVYNCTASLGGVIFQSKDYTSDELLDYADRAMYKIKNSGKNGYILDYID